MVCPYSSANSATSAAAIARPSIRIRWRSLAGIARSIATWVRYGPASWRSAEPSSMAMAPTVIQA